MAVACLESHHARPQFFSDDSQKIFDSGLVSEQEQHGLITALAGNILPR